MNTKHYTKGSVKPVLPNDGKLRLYSMRFCPYAQRAHLVLEAKGVPYHTINIDLTEKPDWLFEANPIGKVPAVEVVNESGNPFLAESLIIAEYLDEEYPNPKLYPDTPMARAQEKLWLGKFENVVTQYYRVVRGSDDIAQALDGLKTGLAAFEDELKHRGTPFFGGNSPNILDYGIWPWFERIQLVKLVADQFEFNSTTYPSLVAWCDLMVKEPAVAKVLIAPELHAEFFKSRAAGKSNYDLLVK